MSPRLLSRTGFICLRCRARAASLWSHPASSIEIQFRPAPSSLTLRSYSVSSRFRNEDLTSYEDLRSTASKDSGWDGIPRRRQKERKRGYFHLPGDLIGQKGHEKREVVQSLEHVALGQQAKIIMLRDARLPKAELQTEQVPLTDRGEKVEATTIPEFLDSINQERRSVTPEDVKRYIDRLRPGRSGTVHSREDLEYTAAILRKGFTKAQLTLYLKTTHATDSGSEKVQPRWLPIITPFEIPHTDASDEIFYQGLTPKEQLVWRILRRQWNLYVKEEVESVGEMDFTLRETEMALLWAHDALFSDIATKRNVKVDISRARGSIRLTADRSACLDSYNFIAHLLDHARTVELDSKALRDLLPSHRHKERILDDGTLRSIGEATSTVVKASYGSDKIIISAVGNEPTVDLNIHDAERLVLSLYPLTATIQDTFVVDGDSPDVPTLMVPASNQVHLDFKHQGRQWFRLRKVSTRDDSPSPDVVMKDQSATVATPSDAIKNQTKAFLDDLPVLNPLPGRLNPWEIDSDAKIRPDSAQDVGDHLNEAKDLTTPSPAAEETTEATGSSGIASWCSETEVDIEATIGQILHQTHGQRTLSPVNVSDIQSLTDSHERALSHAVPKLLHTLSVLDLLEDTPRSEIIVRLSPTPHPTAALPSGIRSRDLPSLEIRLNTANPGPDFSSTASYHITSVKAIIGQRTVDALLLDQPADLRFQSRRTIRLDNADASTAISKYLDSCVFPAQRASSVPSKPMTMIIPAPYLTIAIPRSTIVAATESTNAVTPTKTASAKLLDVEYVTTSVESHFTTLFQYNGLPVAYTCVQAGRQGGQYSTVTLKQAVPNDQRHHQTLASSALDASTSSSYSSSSSSSSTTDTPQSPRSQRPAEKSQHLDQTHDFDNLWNSAKTLAAGLEPADPRQSDDLRVNTATNETAEGLHDYTVKQSAGAQLHQYNGNSSGGRRRRRRPGDDGIDERASYGVGGFWDRE